jgi:DNA-directed RNA polymerase III subunit RPC6
MSPNDALNARHLSYANLSDVLRFIKELGISRVELSERDIETLLETLVFDGKAESQLSVASTTSDSGSRMAKLYRACSLGAVASVTAQSLVSPVERVADGLLRVPCGGCPVIRDCRPGAVISPSTCLYLTQWLDF